MPDTLSPIEHAIHDAENRLRDFDRRDEIKERDVLLAAFGLMVREQRATRQEIQGWRTSWVSHNGNAKPAATGRGAQAKRAAQIAIPPAAILGVLAAIKEIVLLLKG